MQKIKIPIFPDHDLTLFTTNLSRCNYFYINYIDTKLSGVHNNFYFDIVISVRDSDVVVIIINQLQVVWTDYDTSFYIYLYLNIPNKPHFVL